MQIWFNQRWGWSAIKTIVSLSLWLSHCYVNYSVSMATCGYSLSTIVSPQRKEQEKMVRDRTEFPTDNLFLCWRFLERSKSSWESLEDSFPEESQAKNGKPGGRPCLSSGFHLFQENAYRLSSSCSNSTREYCHVSSGQVAKVKGKSLAHGLPTWRAIPFLVLFSRITTWN